MKRHGILIRRCRKRPGRIGLLLAAAVAFGAVAIVGATAPSGSPGPVEPGVSRPSSPMTDDVPNAAHPPGEVRPGMTGGAPPPARLAVAPDQLLVRFEQGTSPDVVTDVLARAGVVPESRINHTGTRVVDVPPTERSAALAALDASRAVEYVESDPVLSAFETVPNDVYWPAQSGARKVALPRAWDVAHGSMNVVVAVLDTGVDFTHPDLGGASVPGYDFVNGDAEPSDDQGHGTAVAGVAAARTNNREGLAGICWLCSVMAVKVLDASGTGNTSTIAQGIVWATDHGADVINLSLGGPASTQTLALAVDYAASKGVTLVAAAGNSGTSSRVYPAAYPAVVSVAATDDSDQRYSWSNYGSWVQVAAPGCNVAPVPASSYGDFCGTSSATPVVAGLAGLALSAKPDANKVALEGAIRSSAVPIQAGVQYGRVEAAQTLSVLGVQAPTAPTPPSSAPPPVTATVRGSLSKRHPRRVVIRTVAAGKIAAKLTFTGTGHLTLSVIDRSGRTIRRVSGASTLRAVVTQPAGAYRFVVSGKITRDAPFTLRLTYPSP
jgi:subtilase family protein/fervidolysin-like protein